MTIDGWTHILTPSYTKRLEAAGQQGPDSFLLAQLALHDVNFPILCSSVARPVSGSPGTRLSK